MTMENRGFGGRSPPAGSRGRAPIVGLGDEVVKSPIIWNIIDPFYQQHAKMIVKTSITDGTFAVLIDWHLFSAANLQISRSPTMIFCAASCYQQNNHRIHKVSKPEHGLRYLSVMWTPSPTHACCDLDLLTCDLQNLIRSSVGVGEYSQSVLSKLFNFKPFVRYHGNNIWPDERKNERTNGRTNGRTDGRTNGTA